MIPRNKKIGKIGQKKGNKIDYTRINSNLINLENKDLLDAFTKVSILTLLAGYKKCDYIFVDDKFNENIDLKKLSRYLSYVLNHKELAPRKFNLRITDKENFISKIGIPKKNNYDGILSFSGGIDSTAGLLNSLDKKQCIQPLWISFGQRNDRAELDAVKRVLAKLKIKPLMVRMDIKEYILKGWKDWDYIIPGRNFLFVSFANAILKKSVKSKNFIYLCAHKDEMKHRRNTDKSKYFFTKASDFFSFDSGKRIIATTPFANISKTEILSYWRKHWIRKYKISPHDTTTCYYGRGCGKCEVCLKRTISLLASGFDVDPFIKIHPMKDPSGFIVNKWIPQIKSGKFTRIKKLDFLIAVEKCLNIVPKKVRDFYNNLPPQTLLAMENRKREIENVKI
jgi:7-cyano-7-deazaguanine synthase in queuosine biosynthesis